jgi:hypothetical protein
MDERYVFWKCYKYTIYALGATIVITLNCSCFTGDLSSASDDGSEGYSTRVVVYGILLIFGALLLIGILSIGAIFCSVKIVILVWTTSSKIAKLLRTDDRQLVFALRRRLYVYLSVVTFCGLLSVIELFIFSIFYVCGTIIVQQVALHFLEFVRHGVESLDEYELRERSISDAVECENASDMARMAPIAPLSPSEREPDSGAKQKKWFN